MEHLEEALTFVHFSMAFVFVILNIKSVQKVANQSFINKYVPGLWYYLLVVKIREFLTTNSPCIKC